MYCQTLPDGWPSAVGGLSGMSVGVPHIPVMLPEVLRALALQADDTVVDATFGAGGYSTAFVDQGANVIAFDRDPSAIDAGQPLVARSEGRLRLVHARFAELNRHIDGQVDAIVADIGVSSMQIDERERGFSFQKDGPLDMRMSNNGPTAADVVNRAERSDLVRIIGILGEERQASRIAAEICAVREKTGIYIHAGARGSGETGDWTPTERSHPSRHAHVSGLADFREPRIRRVGRPAVGSGKRFATRWSAGRGDVPFSGGPVGETVFRRPQPRRWRWFAPSAASGRKCADIRSAQAWSNVCQPRTRPTSTRAPGLRNYASVFAPKHRHARRTGHYSACPACRTLRR